MTAKFPRGGGGSKLILSHPSTSGLGCCPFSGGGSAVVDLLFIVAPIVCVGGVCVWSLLYYSVLCVLLVLQSS